MEGIMLLHFPEPANDNYALPFLDEDEIIYEMEDLWYGNEHLLKAEISERFQNSSWNNNILCIHLRTGVDVPVLRISEEFIFLKKPFHEEVTRLFDLVIIEA